MSKIGKRNYKNKNQRQEFAKKQSPVPQQSEEQAIKNFAKQFDTALNSLFGAGLWKNPIWMNNIIKQINSSPSKFDRDTVLKLLENPVLNEKALKDLHQYLLNNSFHYKRMVYYFATILTFDYYIVPTNADEEDMKTPAFKRSYKKALAWLEKFNVKGQFDNIMKVIMGEDAGFYYLRESDTSITLQRLPSDYCKIVNITDLGYQYAFNMVYFLQPGAEELLENFPPEFVEYYNEFMGKNPKTNGITFYWKILDPEKAWVFKWDENNAGIILPMLALMIDALEIADYKSLLKTKTTLDNWKILFQKIPMREDKDAKMNSFLIDADTAGKFHGNIKGELPPGTTVITSPMNVEAVDFQQSTDKNNIVGLGEQNFYSTAGTSPILFGNTVNSAVGLDKSVKVDEAYVLHMYRVFERFINYNLKQVSGKFRFKVVFPDITIFNRIEIQDSLLKGAQYGFPKLPLAAAYGYTPADLQNLTAFESSLGLVEKLIPLQSSHVGNPSDGGRPQLQEGQLKDGGVKQRELDGNNQT